MLPSVFDEHKTTAGRATGHLCLDFLALGLCDVEESEVTGAELAGDEAGEVADLRRYTTEFAKGEARHAPRVPLFIPVSTSPVAFTSAPGFASSFLAAFWWCS